MDMILLQKKAVDDHIREDWERQYEYTEFLSQKTLSEFLDVNAVDYGMCKLRRKTIWISNKSMNAGWAVCPAFSIHCSAENVKNMKLGEYRKQYRNPANVYHVGGLCVDG